MTTGAGAARGAPRETRQIAIGVTLCFCFSGMTGLIYEVLWTRMLGLVFGHTVFAITTVLAAFMAGLGVGSYLFGRIADRHLRPLLLYGLLEGGIGFYALLTPLLFSGAEAVYIPLYRSLGLSFYTFSLAQFGLIFVILLIPTILMGATLPVLGRFFVRGIEALGEQVGRLYALNTFGAVLGAFAAGFLLIPSLGVKTTLLLAAITNIGIGALVVAFDRHLHLLGPDRLSADPATAVPDPQDPDHVPAAPRGHPAAAVSLTVIGLGISGAASMIYEVAWTRTLSLVIGSSTYAFSTMLVTFLSGLALGSYLFSRLASRLRVEPFVFGLLQLGIGLSALAVTPFFDRMPDVFLRFFQVSQSPGFTKTLQFLFSALAMFLPTFFMGATFPCAMQIASTEMGSVGRDVGRVYFVNTGGAIAGTVLAGFFLIPLWGLQSTLKLAVSMNLCLAVLLFFASGRGWWRKAAAAPIPLLALTVLYFSPPWDALAMTSGVSIYGRNYFGRINKGGIGAAWASDNHLVYYKDGLGATVSVHRRGDNLFLKVNGKTDASRLDSHTQLMLAHLPLLFHHNPQRVLVIGLGSGMTAGAVALHPIQRADVIEIEPAVVEAAALFAKENRQLLQNPRVHVAVADGRNFLLASQGGYDVIISEPSNPWMRGIGNLFSLEFYELAANRMASGGIMCQWIHVYNLSPDDLKMVVKTFRSVFPHTTIWRASLGDLLLVGSKEPLALDAAQIQSRYDAVPGLRQDLEKLGIHSSVSLLADFELSERDAAQFSQIAWLNTDDLPLLEFSAPDSLYADTLDLNIRLLRAFKRDQYPPIAGLASETLRSPEFHRGLGLVFLNKGLSEQAMTQFDEALRLDPRDGVSLLNRGSIHLRSGSVLLAEADLKAALRLDPSLSEAHTTLASLYKAQRLWDSAEDHLRQNVALQPKDPRHLAELADLLREERRFQDAIPLYLSALNLAPQETRILGGLGLAYLGAGRSDEVLEVFRRAASLDPENFFFQYQVGLALLQAKRLDDAAAALQAAIERDPFRPEVYFTLGRLHVLKGEKLRALGAYRRSLSLDPTNPSTFRAVEELSADLYGSGS